MNQENLPTWLQELRSYIDAIPYGDVDLRIKRVRHKTVEIETTSEETVRYEDNQEARKDLDKIVTELVERRFNGDVHIKLKLKNGDIRLLGVFNNNHRKY